MPHKRSHAAQSADRRLSRHTGADSHAPAAQPAIFPVTSFPIPAGLSSPTPRSCPQSKTRLTPRFPTTQAQTRTAQPPSPLSSPLTSSPIPAQLSYPSPLPKRSPTRPALPYHAGTDPHDPAAQPAIFPVTNSPIPAHLSSSSDPYKNPGSRPSPGFFVISGSVRSPSQRRLR